MYYFFIIVFIKDFAYFFLERKEGKREGEKIDVQEKH